MNNANQTNVQTYQNTMYRESSFSRMNANKSFNCSKPTTDYVEVIAYQQVHRVPIAPCLPRMVRMMVPIAPGLPPTIAVMVPIAPGLPNISDQNKQKKEEVDDDMSDVTMEDFVYDYYH